MKKKIIAVIMAVAMLAVLLCGCGNTAETDTNSENPSVTENQEPDSSGAESSNARVITDMKGREVTLPDQIESIATFGSIGVLNTFVETLGAGSKICNDMTDNFANSPRWAMQYEFAPQMKGLPVLESSGEINMEEVLQVNPDLCLVMSESYIEPLEQAGLCVVFVNWKEGDQLKEAVTLLGEILGEEDRAEAYCQFFDDAVAKAEELTANIPEEERRTALYGSITELSNPHAISEWWITAAGGISVSEEAHSQVEGESLAYSMEDLLLWDPDVMFVTSDEAEELKADSNFSGLTAVQNNEIYLVPCVGHTWGNRTTEQPLVVLWAMCKLYPNIYPVDELKADVKEFYSQFFDYDMTDEQLTSIVG